MRVAIGLVLAVALAAHAQESEVDRYVRLLGGSAEEALPALQGIARLGPDAAAAAPGVLRWLWRTTDGPVHEAADRALRGLGMAALPALIADRMESRVVPYVVALGDRAIPALVDSLREDEFFPSRCVVESLTAFGAAALEPLRPLVEEGNGGAAQAVGRMEVATGARLLPALRTGAARAWLATDKERFAIALFRLGDPDGVERMRGFLVPAANPSSAAFEAVRDMGDASRPLIPLLHRCLPAHPIDAAAALWAVEGEAGPLLPHIARALGGVLPGEMDTPYFAGTRRRRAMELMGRMGYAAYPLSTILLSLAVEGNRDAEQLLEKTGLDRAMLPRMVLWVETGEPNAQSWALRVIASSGEACADEAAPAVWKAAYAKDRGVRTSAAWALWRMKRLGQGTVPQLIQLLENTNVDSAPAIVLEVGKYWSDAAPAVPALRLVCLTYGDHVQGAVMSTLARIGSGAAAALPEIEQALRTGQPQTQLDAARAYTDVVTPAEAKKSQALFDAMLRAPDFRTRLAGCFALLHIDTEGMARRVAPVASEVLALPEQTHTYEALWVLCSCKEKASRYARQVEALLETEEPAIRSIAAATHWRITGKKDRALPVLRALLDRNNPVGVRVDAATSAGWVGRRAKPLLPDVRALLDLELSPARRALVERAIRDLQR